jgi:hypothetical protein
VDETLRGLFRQWLITGDREAALVLADRLHELSSEQVAETLLAVRTDCGWIKIDDGLMRCAVSLSSLLGAHGAPEERAFLNRKTGEIVFFPDNEERAEAWYGAGAATAAVRNRARVEASQQDWIEIPQTDSREDDVDGFIQDFLRQHGILATLK